MIVSVLLVKLPSRAPPHGADRPERPGRHSGGDRHGPHAARRAGSGHADGGSSAVDAF